MKKVYVLIFLGLIIIMLTSCTTYNSLVPKLSEWDGNYIYYENKLSKTTGEDEEVLFDKMAYLDKGYFITDITNHSYIGDYVYFACSLRENLEVYDKDCSAIGKFNLKTKMLTVLYFLNDDTFDYVTRWYYNDNYLVTGVMEHLVRISLTDDSVDIIDEIDANEIYNDQIFMIIDDKLYYCDINDLIYKQISTYKNVFKFHVSNNHDADIVTIFNGSSYALSEIYIYELESKETYCIFNETDNKTYIDVSDKYLIIGDIINKTVDAELKDYPKNNKLYEYVYDGNNVILNEIYQFDEHLHISKAYADNDRYIQITTYNKKDSRYMQGLWWYTFDVKYKKLSDNMNKELEENKTTKYSFGEYTYYIESRNDSFYVNQFYTVYLKRKDKKGKIITLQFYSNHESHNEDEYPSSSFISLLDFARLDQVIITNKKF